MKSLLLLITVFTINLSYGQIISGNYSGYGTLDLAFDKQNQRLTGNYQFYSGFNLKTGIPRFTCNFYFDGILVNNNAIIKAYCPLGKDTVSGELTISGKEITFRLTKELNGCWNAEYLVNKPTAFTLDEPETWIAVKHITADKAFFYSTPDNNSKTKAYILKGDIVFVDSIKSNWIHCTYYGEKKNTIGWINTNVVNN